MISNMMFSLAVAAALAASPYRPLPGVSANATPTGCTKERKMTAESHEDGVANLPFAMGKKFATLDAYLAHLQCYAGPIDKPWWKEVRPGVYEHMTTATNGQRETATRAELMKRFHFSR
jgi:hypothetical protein